MMCNCFNLYIFLARFSEELPVPKVFYSPENSKLILMENLKEQGFLLAHDFAGKERHNLSVEEVW